MGAAQADPAAGRRRGGWPAIAAGIALVLSLSAVVLIAGGRSLAHPIPACPSSRIDLIDRMALAALILAGASAIAAVVGLIGAAVRRQASPALMGAAAIALSCVAGAAAFHGYLCFNVTGLVGSSRLVG